MNTEEKNQVPSVVEPKEMQEVEFSIFATKLQIEAGQEVIGRLYSFENVELTEESGEVIKFDSLNFVIEKSENGKITYELKYISNATMLSAYRSGKLIVGERYRMKYNGLKSAGTKNFHSWDIFHIQTISK